MPRISLIIPVFNRPEEVDELLDSLSRQRDPGFEVVIVEDGSTEKCEEVIKRFEDTLEISYYYKENSGPGPSRNYGSEMAKGDFMVFVDSDCLIPPHYIATVREGLDREKVDAFGGPDRAHESFSILQKSISFSMTSFLTTGGIRGGGEKLGKFHPRSFNMGFSREVFRTTGGFAPMRFGEDVDLSIRILEQGFKTGLFRDAWVYHKRRTNVRQFFKQVFNSGIARINLYKRHPSSLRAVHFAPAFFTLGSFALILLGSILSPWFFLPLLLHMILIFFTSTLQNRCIRIGFLSILTSYIQLLAYGSGFLIAFWKRLVLGREEYAAFTRNFYK